MVEFIESCHHKYWKSSLNWYLSWQVLGLITNEWMCLSIIFIFKTKEKFLKGQIFSDGKQPTQNMPSKWTSRSDCITNKQE